MQETFEFGPEENRIVYVKTVPVEALPQEVREQVGDLDKLFAVHDAEGQQLALVADRGMAFRLARQHDYAPVAVH